MTIRLLKIIGVTLAIALHAMFMASAAHSAPKNTKIVQAKPGAFENVNIYGVTVYDPQHIWDYAVLHAHHKASEQPTPNEIGESIKQLYREDGYFLAEVEYRVSGSTLQIFVHEGHIKKIEVSGVGKETANAIANYIKTAIGEGPVKIEKFERGVMLAKDMSGVVLTTEFEVTDHTGNDLLKISAKEFKQRGSLSLNNMPRNFGNGIWGMLSQEVYSVINPGDFIRVNLLPSADFNNQWQAFFGSIDYRTPLNSNGLYGEISAGNGLTRNNNFISVNQNPKNLYQNTTTANATVGYPIIRDSRGFLYSVSEFNFYTLDMSGTGVPAIDQGGDIATGVLRQSLVYSKNDGQSSTFRAGLTASVGKSGVQYYGNQALNNANFYDLRLGSGYTTPLDNIWKGLGLRIEGMGQWTTSTVPNVEKYFLGDYTRLRGYGYSEVIGDMGVNGTFELSQYFPIGIPYFGSIAPFVFADGGWLKQNTYAPGYITQLPLASAGFGFQTSSNEKFGIRSWIGVPLLPGFTTPANSPTFWVQLTQAW